MTTISYDDVFSFEVHNIEELLNGRYRRVIEVTDMKGDVLRINLSGESFLRLTAIFSDDNDRPGDSNAA